MLSELREIAARLRDVAHEFDAAVVTGQQAAALVEAATAVERTVGSIRARAAARAAEAQAWKEQGYRSPEEWLSSTTGTSTGHARRRLTFAKRLTRHERTRDEYAAGNLSEEQADLIAGAAEENPDAEADLVEAAKRESLARLREEAAKAKAAAGDEEARQARLHHERSGFGGTDEEGAYRFSARMAGMQGGIFDTIWRGFRTRIARDAKRRGERLTAAQVGADALVLMAQTAAEHRDGSLVTAGAVLPDVKLHLLVHHDAWQRGHTEAGETCEIDGIGPIPVSHAKTLAGQGAFVAAATFDGTDVHRVAHLGTCDPLTLTADKVSERLAGDGVDIPTVQGAGRHVPAVLDTAITIRDRTCTTPGCDRRWALQRDHIHAVELGGLTTYRNLQRLCWHHHTEKTRGDLRLIRARRRRSKPPG